MKKNIHILATDQPTGIFETNSGLQFSIMNKVRYGEFKGFHIYITSDEEIKKDSWVIKDNKLMYLVFLKVNSSRSKEGALKVILSTDPTLIEDGVQAIDDEFLEWFIKNPDCEFVEVEERRHFEADKSKRVNPLNGVYYLHKIIIPQEEPKLDNLEERFKRDMSMVVMPLDNENIPEEPKQVICRDKFDRVIQDGCYVDVQKDGVHKVYRKEDGQLYFKPYGEEERVSNYFSNDLILIPYSTKLITDLKKEIADKKQEGYSCPHTKIQCDDECCVSAEDCHIISSLSTGMVDCKEPKQETLEEAAERLYPTTIDSFTDTGLDLSERERLIFIAGAKHQAQRMYSEEEMYSALQKLRLVFKSGVQKWQEDFEFDLDKWFEQFKKG